MKKKPMPQSITKAKQRVDTMKKVAKNLAEKAKPMKFTIGVKGKMCK